MYIISEKKDYYDSVAYLNGEVDKSVVYKRSESELKRYHETFFKNRSRGRGDGIDLGVIEFPQFITCHIIGFCGKTYVATLLIDAKEVTHPYKAAVTHYTYDVEEVVDYALKGLEDNYRFRMNYYLHKKESYPQQVRDFYHKWHNVDQTELFHTLQVPIFRIRGEKVILNPLLKEYEFYKLKDAYSAFQSIEGFIGGVLTNTEQEVRILDEKTAVTAHGFDKTHAFRTRPRPNTNRE